MGMLPVTLIFVLSASLVVALVYLPVMGGVTGRLEQWMAANMERIAALPWYLHILLFPAAFVMIFPACHFWCRERCRAGSARALPRWTVSTCSAPLFRRS